MRLDYLTLQDKNEYLRLMDCLVESDVNDNMWKAFFQTYDESYNKVIYMARIYDEVQAKEITVGTATTVIDYKVYLSGPVVQIEDLIVFPKYRNLGLGKKIVKAIEADTESYNASVITVSCGNEGLAQFFQKALLGEKSITSKNVGVGVTISEWI